MNYPELIIPCPNGVAASEFSAIMIDLSVEGIETIRKNGQLICTADISKGVDPNIQFATLVAIVQAGGSFKHIRMGMQITQPLFNTNVPAGVPGATYIDEEEVEQYRTWIEWANANTIEYKVKDDGSDAILKTAWQGQLMDSEALTILHTTVGIAVYDWDDFLLGWNAPAYNPEI